MKNRFPGRCPVCGGYVPASTGTMAREGDKWVVRHATATD